MCGPGGQIDVNSRTVNCGIWTFTDLHCTNELEHLSREKKGEKGKKNVSEESCF